MKVYITKFALTQGILAVDAEINQGESMATYRPAGSFAIHAHGPDWWETPDEARRRAEVVRDKKVAALRKQIETLEALRFDVITDHS